MIRAYFKMLLDEAELGVETAMLPSGKRRAK